MHYTILIFSVFFLLTNTLLLSGLAVYGDDTGSFDLPLRVISGALLRLGDFPFWYAEAGDGFPQLSLEFTPWVANPLGTILGAVRSYDFLNLAIENVIWRTIGFMGAYRFARSWGVVPIGAAAVAATYVGSGTMSRAAIAFATLIGQMIAPWVLVSGSWAILAPDWPRVIRAGAVLGLTLGAMVWFAYPGAWVSAPIVSGPLLLGLAMTHPKGLQRLTAAGAIGVGLTLTLIALILSETVSGPSGLPTPSYRAAETWMLVGQVRAVDFLGMLLVNPSYTLEGASDALQPLYGGVLPPLVLLATVGAFPRLPRALVIILSLICALILANSQNWALWDHPLFRNLNPSPNLRTALDNMVLPALVLLPASLVSLVWPFAIPFRKVDRVLLGGAAWVALIATDNPFANLLRFHVPPFNLVRHNMLYFWLVSLVLATVAWNRLESVFYELPEGSANESVPGNAPLKRPPPNTTLSGSPLVRGVAIRLGFVGAGVLGILALAGLTTRDAKGTAGYALVGAPHIVWQIAILAMALTTVSATAWRGRRSRSFDAGWMLAAIGMATATITLGGAIVAVAMRSHGVAFTHVLLTDTTQLSIDLLHILGIVVGAIFVLRKARDRFSSRVLIASLMVLDAAIAIPRFYSDNQRFSPAPLGWPLHFEESAESFFVPDRGDGSRKGDFWQPFTGSFRPPPTVNRTRMDWGDAYETWVHFPTQWSIAPGSQSASVTRESLGETLGDTAQRRPPTWGVSASNTGGRANQIAPVVAIDPLALRHNACDQLVAPDAPSGASSSGRVTRLLATTVEVPFTADCDRLLVFTDSWAPGWSATIDGVPTPVLRVNNAIRGVMVPAGEHALQWRYRPRFLAPLLALLAAGLAISGILIAAPWWSRRFPLPHRLDRLFGFGPLPPDEIFGPTLAPLPNTPVPAISPSSTDTPARDWQRLPAMWPHSLPIALPLTGLAILVLASVTAYDPRIDGPTQGFRLFLFRSVLAGLWAWIVIAGRTGFRSPVGPSLMLLVLLPPLALQVARHTYPIQAGTPLATIATDFRSPSWQSIWEVTHRGNAPGDPGSNGTILRNDGPNAMAITFATTPIPKDLWPWWRRPLGKIGPGPLDVTWTASLDRSGPYYTVATLGRLTIQALKNGYLVTAPVPGGDVRGDFLEVPDTGQPGPVRWLLHIEPDAGASLSLDDRQVWKGGHPGVIERITLGDASNDPEHRGTMSITDASIVQRVSVTEP